MCRLDTFPHASLSSISAEAFARVGPLLCLYPSNSGELNGWQRARSVCAESCVDADGVRESLRLLDDQGRSCLRLFLLPDSDYSVWEALRARLPCVAGESRARACASCALYRFCTRERGWKASLLRLAPSIDDGGATMGWTAVSEVGRGIARRIALAEGVAPPLGA